MAGKPSAHLPEHDRGNPALPKALEENADNIYPASDNLPVAYASNDVNSTANTARGSLNLTESRKLDNGYKFVWEFTPSQGNGTIAAAALTSKFGGQNAFGSLVNDASTFLLVKDVNISAMTAARQMVLFEEVELDFEKNLLYSISFKDSSILIRRVRLPVFHIGLNEKLDDSTYTLLEEKAIPAQTFRFFGDYARKGEFMDGFVVIGEMVRSVSRDWKRQGMIMNPFRKE